jgi:hypothetical protein
VPDFFVGHTAEVAHLDDLGLPLSEGRKFFQRDVNIEDLFDLGCSGLEVERKVDSYRAVAPLLGSLGSCMIDQDMTHYLCRDRQEVSPALPWSGLRSHEPHECLMDQGRWLKGVTRILRPKKSARELPQLGV